MPTSPRAPATSSKRFQRSFGLLPQVRTRSRPERLPDVLCCIWMPARAQPSPPGQMGGVPRRKVKHALQSCLLSSGRGERLMLGGDLLPMDDSMLLSVGLPFAWCGRDGNPIDPTQLLRPARRMPRTASEAGCGHFDWISQSPAVKAEMVAQLDCGVRLPQQRPARPPRSRPRKPGAGRSGGCLPALQDGWRLGALRMRLV